MAERSRQTTPTIESEQLEQQQTKAATESEPATESKSATELVYVKPQHPERGTNTVTNSNTQQQTDVTQENRVSTTNAPDEALRTVSDSVRGSTLLEGMSINKVKVELKGIKRDAPVIALAETSRVKGVHIESGINNSLKGKLQTLDKRN